MAGGSGVPLSLIGSYRMFVFIFRTRILMGKNLELAALSTTYPIYLFILCIFLVLSVCPFNV